MIDPTSAIKKKGRYANKAYLGPANSGKTHAALRDALKRKLSVYVDITNNVDHGIVVHDPDEIVRAMVGPFGDPRRGGHFTWQARGQYEAGDGSFAAGLRRISKALEDREGSATLILDEVGSITLSSRDQGRGSDKDAIREMVRISKTGHQTQVSAWMITQQVQELPRHAELEFRNIFGIGDAAERRYYQKNTGGWQLIRALECCEDLRRRADTGRPERPYVSLARCPTLHPTAPWRPHDSPGLYSLGRSDAELHGERLLSRISPCGRVLMCPQHGGGLVPGMAHGQWIRIGE